MAKEHVRAWTWRVSLWRAGGGILVTSWLLKREAIRVAIAGAHEVAGNWELVAMQKAAPPIALLVAAPILLAIAIVGSLAARVEARWSKTLLALATIGCAVPWGLATSTGRKAQQLSWRLPWLAFVIASALVLSMIALPFLVRAVRRARLVAAPVGLTIAAMGTVADQRVLPRLYPLLHASFVVIALAGIVLAVDAARVVESIRWRRLWRWKWDPRRMTLDLMILFGALSVRGAVKSLAWGGPELAKYDNARRILVDRSLPLGRAATLALRKWPARPLDPDVSTPDPLSTDPARALSANGRDVLLVTIDALRADHVGAYGYARATTPAIDALAREGTTFMHAYTPTPHTSYAIASLMTGKYLRPIFELQAASGGVRTGDETWAALFRGYGFRTAAFFPPAIFFVDADRFADLRKRALDFEYSKEEFAAPDLRASQIEQYLAAAPHDHPLFVWVHLFEPHEPYVTHAGHDFGASDVDRYDSEIAAADEGVGQMVRAFRSRSPSGIVIVTADHGEAFGEHDARYHGTTVYEEQVRVPLVMSAPGLFAQQHIAGPVQLIDLMPTALSMYGLPRPVRVRGRDLSPWLVDAKPKVASDGVAFSEVDDQLLYARGDERLICGRSSQACALYDVGDDPGETRPLTTATDRAATLRRELGALMAESERREAIDGPAAYWPEALRRAMAGDATAALDVAPLLDDVDPRVQYDAAKALAKLGDPATLPHLRRASSIAKVPRFAAWLKVATARCAVTVDAASRQPHDADAIDNPESMVDVGNDAGAMVDVLVVAIADWRPVASPRVLNWAADAAIDSILKPTPISRDVVRALSIVGPHASADRAKLVTAPLLRALDDVRLRAVAATALGVLDDDDAAEPLRARLATERHLDARGPEAIALLRLGDVEHALPLVQWMLGVPEPPPDASEILSAICATATRPPPWMSCGGERATLTLPLSPAALAVPARLIVGSAPAPITIACKTTDGATTNVDAKAIGTTLEFTAKQAPRARLEITSSTPKRALPPLAWVPRVEDLPPPKPDRGLHDPPAPTP
ncbi:MAG: sulfatase-like hydrolase/transferase [Polyangiales bacterium]